MGQSVAGHASMRVASGRAWCELREDRFEGATTTARGPIAKFEECMLVGSRELPAVGRELTVFARCVVGERNLEERVGRENCGVLPRALDQPLR